MVPIQADPRGFILGDQRVNGLWGLFSVSARVSGLIPDGSVGLTPEATEFVEREYVPILQPAIDGLSRLVAEGGWLDTNSPDAVFSALAQVLSESFTGEEQRFYGEYLCDGAYAGNQRSARQEALRELLVDHIDLQAPTDRAEIMRLYEAARSVDDDLAKCLHRIARVEAVLAPAMSVFDFLLTRHHRRLDNVADELTERWDTSVPNIDSEINQDLLVEVNSVWAETGRQCFDRCQRGLSSGDYRGALQALLEWHKHVMNTRGGASWVQVAEDGTLDVRYRGTEQELPLADELPELWRNGYFIDSLKAITRQLGNAA